MFAWRRSSKAGYYDNTPAQEGSVLLIDVHNARACPLIKFRNAKDAVRGQMFSYRKWTRIIPKIAVTTTEHHMSLSKYENISKDNYRQ